MIGSLIGAGLSAVGSIWGGSKASSAMRKAKRGVEKQKRENRDWYNRRYNEDATERADARSLLTKTEDAILRRNRAAAGSQAVVGGTEESVAASKAANGRALADAVGQIAVAEERRKDAIESEYRERDAQLQGQLDQIETNRAIQTAKATEGVLKSAGNIGSVIDEYAERRRESVPAVDEEDGVESKL